MNKRFIFRLLFLAGLGAAVHTPGSAQEAWKPVPGRANETHQGHFGIFQVDFNVLKAGLNAASGARSSKQELSIPDPWGQTVSFSLEETHIYQLTPGTPALDIHTYTGYSLRNRETIHLTCYKDKIYGIVLGTERNWYLSSDEAKGINGSTKNLVAIFDQAGRPLHSEAQRCGVDDAQIIAPKDRPSSGVPLPPPATASVNSPLKIYRLAIAGTAEYVNYFGTQADAIANTVALVNNLNAIYERDMGIRFTLVTGNNVMYTNPATDPFNNPSTKCGELPISRSNFVTEIGVANYDLGITLYGENFGGCAYSPAACANNNKGGAVAGYDVPTPTSYLLEVTGHEIGHLFGSGHTHTAAVSSNCSSTIGASSAWEPGGGSTIMAYHNCAPSFAALNSVLYFHNGNIGQMQNYVASASGNCYTTTGGPNTSPAINTATDNVFFIPISTPYKLEANATDAEDQNTLTYTFDQMDLGTANALRPASTNTSGPLVRSFFPSNKAFRYIPRIDSLVAGIYPVFETLPSVARNMTFWATVRDNHSGNSSNSRDTINITTAGSTPFTVTSQNTPTSVAAGSSLNITWDVAATDAAPFNTANVKILYAADGLNYDYVLLASTPNNGSATVSMPNIASSGGRIMVAAIGNLFFNINTADITVSPACANVQSSHLFPERSLLAQEGDASLALNIFPAFGAPVSRFPGEFNSTDPVGVIGVLASSTDTNCAVASSFSGRYDTYHFQVTEPGNYTVTRTNGTLSGNLYMSLYGPGGFTATNAAACNNFLHRSSVYTSPSGTTGHYNTFNFNGSSNGEYYIAALKSGSSNFGTYTMFLTGPGKVYTEFKNPATNYSYLVVNSAGTIIASSSTVPDLRNQSDGEYRIYGVSHSPSLNMASFQNQPLDNIANGSFNSSDCVSLSGNSIAVTILSNTPLALNQLTLRAAKEWENIKLAWQPSGDEADIRQYELEHGTDGRNFTNLLTATPGSSYQYLHQAPGFGTHFYRVRARKLNGEWLYSNIATAEINTSKYITISPNPVRDMLTINAKEYDLPMEIRIFDMNSRLMKSFVMRQATHNLSLAELPAGTYLIRGEGFTEKIVKQ